MKIKELTREELKKKLDAKEDFLLINVLSKASFDSLRIEGSKHADVHQPDFLEKIEKLTVGDKNKEIIVYCASFTCQASPGAARKLDEGGYTNVYDYSGGLADWKEGGYSVEGSMVK